MAVPEAAAPEGAPPGWYPDPSRGARLRYWDGREWTAGVSDGSGVRELPLDPEGAAAAWEDLEDRRAEWPSWLAAVGLAAIVAGTMGAFAVGLLVDVATDVVWARIGIPQLVLWGSLLATCRWASRHHGSGDFRRDFGLRFRGMDVATGIGVATAARILSIMLVIPIVLADRELAGTNTTMFDVVEGNGAAVALLVLIALVGAPLIEEVFFRGLFQRALECRLPVAAAIGLQAVLFGAVHISPAFGRTNVTIVAATAAAGVVFGITARHARRLGPAIVGHAVFNVLPVLLLLSS